MWRLARNVKSSDVDRRSFSRLIDPKLDGKNAVSFLPPGSTSFAGEALGNRLHVTSHCRQLVSLGIDQHEPDDVRLSANGMGWTDGDGALVEVSAEAAGKIGGHFDEGAVTIGPAHPVGAQ